MVILKLLWAVFFAVIIGGVLAMINPIFALVWVAFLSLILYVTIKSGGR